MAEGAALGAGLCLGIALGLATSVAIDVAVPDTLKNELPACSSEDGREQRLCFWDANEQGNGIGESFISDDHGRVTYRLVK